MLDDIQAWCTLKTVYPIVCFDAMMVGVRQDRSVQNRGCYLALGVTCDGDREVLRYVNHRDKKKVATALMYTAANTDDALHERDAFEAHWALATPLPCMPGADPLRRRLPR